MVVEITTFTLAPGVDDATFLEADADYQAELMVSQPGFVRRTLARDGHDWVAVAFWASDEDAMHAETNRTADHAPAGVAFRRLLDPSSVSVARYRALDQ